MKSCLHGKFRLLALLLLWLAGCLPIAAYFWPEETWIRLDLASRGIFFVRVVDKMQVVELAKKYDAAGHMQLRSLVLSGDRLIGYTMCPIGWYPYFAPATGKIDWSSRADYEASIRMEEFAFKYWKARNRESAAIVGAAVIIPCTAWFGLIAFRFWRARCAESVSLGAQPP